MRRWSPSYCKVKILLSGSITVNFEDRLAISLSCFDSKLKGPLGIQPNELVEDYVAQAGHQAVRRGAHSGADPDQALYILTVFVWARLRPDVASALPTGDRHGILRILANLADVTALFFVTFGGIYFGWISPTEAAAVGAFGGGAA